MSDCIKWEKLADSISIMLVLKLSCWYLAPILSAASRNATPKWLRTRG